MAKQGFYFDMSACIGCRTCQVACKDKNDLEIGNIFRNVADYEVGKYPAATAYHLSASCNHCENPACVANCPTGAMWINEEDGTVQHHDSICIGCETCVKSCPYGVPEYIESLSIVQKCNACIELRAAGENPACVAACPMRALKFGPIEELVAAYPNAVRDIAVLPDSTQTNSCTIIEAKPNALDAGYTKVIF